MFFVLYFHIFLTANRMLFIVGQIIQSNRKNSNFHTLSQVSAGIDPRSSSTSPPDPFFVVVPTAAAAATCRDVGILHIKMQITRHGPLRPCGCRWPISINEPGPQNELTRFVGETKGLTFVVETGLLGGRADPVGVDSRG